MTDFFDLVDEYLGDSDSMSDIRLMVKKLYFYDFAGYPTRIWAGQGTLYTSDGNVWLGSVDGNGKDHHTTPTIQDGRDGSSSSYTFSLEIPDMPGQSAYEQFNDVKSNQALAVGRNIRVYLVPIDVNEGMRPSNPIMFYKELVMVAPTFSESVSADDSGALIKNYTISVTAKDGNIGRAIVPNGTYTDTVQKRRAAEKGVTIDKGCEYVASLANRTMIIP